MKHKNMNSQAGFTLIELTVVLLILVGLAGLLLPYVSGYLAKTHNSTAVKTLADLNNTIQRYQTTKWALPSKLETLVDTGGTAIYNKLQNTAMLTALTAGAAQGFANGALASAGVTEAYANNNATTDATFQSTTGAVTAVSQATPIPLAQLTGTNATDTFFNSLPANLLTTDQIKNQLIYAFGGDGNSYDTACHNYIVMGIGSSNSMVGSVMQSVPVHFSGTGANSTDKTYNRYLAVFAVPNGTTTPGTTDQVTGKDCTAELGESATFIGTALIFSGFPAIVGLNGSQQFTNSNLLN
jgi:prepilin-type N-terminal cleavage/methylation domain-containing protein